MKFLKKLQIRLDLGVRFLLPEWKKFFSPYGLKRDLIAGLTVACVAVPLSLAIALASGVAPAVGLVTAIVAGIVCALFGGTPLAVSGPAAAMAVLIADTVQKFGTGGLIAIGLICGILQILTGVFSLGRIIRFVPMPVIAGFTAGIGAIILIGQLPRALALPPPDQSHVLDVIVHIKDLIHQTQPLALGMALLTVLITFVLPRQLPKLPAPLIAVIVPTLIVHYFGFPLQTIGEIPSSLPVPHLPTIPNANLADLMGTAFMIYALASLETLLSSSAADKLSKVKRHDPDQELIGQGLGNIASSMFGGIPVTGVIARTALNIHAGAKSRRAAIIHAVALLFTVYFFSPAMSKIPTSVLAGILLSVALRMLHPRELLQIWKVSRVEALIYVVTFITIVFTDLLAGIQAGIGAALVIAAIRLGRTQVSFHEFESESSSLVRIDGPLTFLSSSKIESLRNQLGNLKLNQGLVIDMSDVSAIDASGAEQLIELFEQIHAKKVRLVLQGLSQTCKGALLSQVKSQKLMKLISGTDNDLAGEGGIRSLDRLVHGVDKFQKEIKQNYGFLFKKLADGQSPHTLFITCSDSRIDPNLITSTQPGELFIVRNVGNIIPAFGHDGDPAEGAAVEFAVGVLGVKHIVVCGHSGCGAMKAILSEQIFTKEESSRMPSLSKWLSVARDLKKNLSGQATPEQASELNAITQLENLKTYPIIRKEMEKGKLQIHAWFYDIGEAKLEQWEPEKGVYVEIGSKAARSFEKRVEAGVQFQAPVVVHHKPKK